MSGRSSGFVRMHYDLASEAQLAWASYPYFRDWKERVGAGDCSFVRTGFVQLVPPALSDALSWGVYALDSSQVALARLDGVQSLDDLDEIADAE